MSHFQIKTNIELVDIDYKFLKSKKRCIRPNGKKNGLKSCFSEIVILMLI